MPSASSAHCSTPSEARRTAARLRELHRAFPQRYPVLLENVGRRTLLFAAHGEPEVPSAGETIFSAIDRVLHSHASQGVVFYVAYEALTDIERIVVPPAPFSPLPPRGFAQPVACSVSFDHASRQLTFQGDDDAIAIMRSDMQHVGVDLHGRPFPMVQAISIGEDPPEDYLAAVRRAKEYIVAGDVFQANLSREWRLRVDTRLDAADLYRSLRAANPAPFAALVRFGDAAIVSSSPERLLRGGRGVLESRPIAGTRPRAEDDAVTVEELKADEKEQAEHLMLVDLIRNDLGKVALPGSVEVDEFMAVESYAHVHHLVSNVRCTPVLGTTVGQALAAMFPGGTITGCPKVRCMEIIAELEGVGRGAYTGTVGYVNADGDFDCNILIRTMVWRPGEVRFRAGAGIVTDSVPARELAETRAKAEGLLRAFSR